MRRNKTTEWLKQHPIVHEKVFEIEDPFKLLNISELTDIQQAVQKYAKLFKYYATFAFSASCGAGKTLAGIYLMHRFGVKTLIVSTRSAINDQWEYILKSLYPNLKIQSIHNKGVRTRCKDPDVYIYSPQYLTRNSKKFPADVKFIIYDEIHSIVSDNYGKCVMEPLTRLKGLKVDELCKQTPYMLALSGTYPRENKIIDTVFGKYIPTVSKITEIPVYVYDIHAEWMKNKVRGMLKKSLEEDVKTSNVRSSKDVALSDKSKLLKDMQKMKSLCDVQNKYLIQLDKNYNALDDYEYIDSVVRDDLLKKYNIEITPKFRGYIITENIDSSVYSAILFSEKYNCNVLLMRSVEEPSYVITPTGRTEFDRMVLTQEFLTGKKSKKKTDESETESDVEDIEVEGDVNETDNNEVSIPKHNYKKIDMRKNDLQVVLKENDISILCGCYHRLKEGISVENAVWGICTKFIYSPISRVQILGRIRRTSKNPEIANHKRVFLVNSGKVLTNEFMLLQRAKKFHTKMDYSKIATTYDFEYEKKVFEQENYVYDILKENGK